MKSNLIQTIGLVFPGFTAGYLERRARLASAKRLYEAATFSNYRPKRGGQYSGDANMQKAGTNLRNLSRYLEENSDLVVGILDDLVNNTVGQGVKLEPLVMTRSGELAEEVNDRIRALWDEWGAYPEVTSELGMVSMERQVARALFRDGELFFQTVTNATFRYRTRVPLALELVEADWVPFDLIDEKRGIVHGIERNGWGQTTAFHVLKRNPDQVVFYPLVGSGDTRRVPAARMAQIKFCRRIGQARGVPIIHAAIERLRDLKDYEESERIAAKISSSIGLALERDASLTGVTVSDSKRELQMEAGAIWELHPGEKISTVGSDRPNTGLSDFRNAMMRAVAAGSGTRYSSISRDYNGTYSAQRQELVEGSIGYRALFRYLEARFYRPTYNRFLDQCLFSGLLAVPRGVDAETLRRADFHPPALPWIDPVKEANAWKTLVDTQLSSRSEIARQRGRDPKAVRDEIEAEKKSGLYDPITPQAQPQADADQDGDDDRPALEAANG